jgi:subtilisin
MLLARFTVLIITLLFFTLPTFLSAQDNTVIFKNYSEDVVLEPAQNGFYQLQLSAVKVQLAPRLIVKTVRQTTNTELLALVPSVTQITDLFLMQQYRYVLLHFSNQAQALEALDKLQQEPVIALVQPDLQQQRMKAESLTEPEVVAQSDSAFKQSAALPFYLRLVHNKGLWPGRGGAGITVAVIDDGFALQQSELSQLHTRFYYDFSSKQIVNTGVSVNAAQGRHGTLVAGILFGAHNGQAPEGLVPKADFVGISQADTWTSQTLQSFYLAYLAKADVINCSWHTQWLLEPVQDVVDELSRYGRSGKGAAVVFAAGNEGKHLTPRLHEATIASAIVVGASNAQGHPLTFSNFGGSVDVWAFGEPVTSVDHYQNYRSFSGTSLAAAITTGYIGLLLERNPSLTLIQVQDQLKQIIVE